MTMRKLSIVAISMGIGTAVAFTASAQDKALCDRLGGPPAISAVVDSFSDKAPKDERINKKFAKSDPNRLVTNLKHFVEVGSKCAAAKYEGRTMKVTHEHMSVTDGEFNALVEDLSKTLDEFKVPAKEKGELLATLGAYKNEIVEKPGDMKTGTELPASFKPAPPLKK
jgi:hemoglobin